MTRPSLWTVEPATLEFIDQMFALEKSGYPPDEAASRDQLAYRIQNASKYFWMVKNPDKTDEVIGFSCGTVLPSSSNEDPADGTVLTHDCMSKHSPNGNLLCIHSVCVDERWRRKGIAYNLLRAQVENCGTGSHSLVKEIRLLCKEGLVPLYALAGFEPIGPSDVVHGKDMWIEMKHSISSSD